MAEKIPNRQNWKFGYNQEYTREELIELFETRMFIRLQRMIDFENLPEDIPARDFKLFLQGRGVTGVVEVNGVKYAIRDVSAGGKLDAYYHATNWICTNPYISGLKHEYTKGVDIAIIYHDSMEMGLYPIVHKYSVLLTDIYITMGNQTIIERAPYLLSASGENTKATLEETIANVKAGKLSVTLDKKSMADPNSIKSFNFGNIPVGALKELIELENYLQSSLEMEIGLNSNYNMKREYVNSDENQIDSVTLVPQIEDILESIQKGLDEMNRIFGTNTKVKLGKAWQKVKETALSENEDEADVEEDETKDTVSEVDNNEENRTDNND